MPPLHIADTLCLLPLRSRDKSRLLSPDSLAGTPGYGQPAWPGPRWPGALGRVCLQTGTYRLESPAELLPKCNFGSALLCPQNKTSLHRTAAAMRSQAIVTCTGVWAKIASCFPPSDVGTHPAPRGASLGPLCPSPWLAGC